MPTPNAAAMQAVVGTIAPLLKAAGFRKQRHGFNRRTPGELTHVVHFQMGQNPGFAAEQLPEGFPPSLAGSFTVNLGVHVPGIARQRGRTADASWVNEYDCHLRRRIGDLLAAHEDWWWPLDQKDRAAGEVREAIELRALPWLDAFEGPWDVVDLFYDEEADRRALGGLRGLDVGLLLLDLGDQPRAEEVIAAYLLEPHHERHREWLGTFLPQRGLGHLLPGEG